MADDVQIGVRMPRELVAAIERIAAREHRTVSGQVRAWVQAAVQADESRLRDQRAREDRLERDRWGEP